MTRDELKHAFQDAAMAALLTLRDHAVNFAINMALQSVTRTTATKLGAGTYNNAARLITARALAKREIDGRISNGPAVIGWAKFHSRKLWPKPGEPAVLGGEDRPHTIDDFSGRIGEGYGKGFKKLIYKGNVVIKIDGDRPFIAKANIHEHRAEKAGVHYDFVAEGIKPGTKKFEVNIPTGPFKGRYAFLQPPKMENSNVLIVRMKDEGVTMPKPKTMLKPVEWLDKINKSAAHDDYIAEWKPDGGLAIADIKGDYNQVVYTSWREQAPAYYDKLPWLERIQNNSPYVTDRLINVPNFKGTRFYVELFHPGGASRVGGILNSGADKAIQFQEQHGPVEAYVWDIVKYKGKDVYNLPYYQRREIYESFVDEVRHFNRNIHVVPKCTGDFLGYYESIVKDPRGLPYAEGIMVKPKMAVDGDTVFKVKHRDFIDCKVLEFIEGEGKYKGSLGRVVVEPEDAKKGIGEVGSFQVTDEQRQWIWDNRNLLEGQVAEISTQGRGPEGAVLKGVFFRWHPSKSEAALKMYADVANPDDPMSALYAMKSAAGWRRK